VEIIFAGCGEAFDELPNTSLLIRTDSAKVLLDCGYSVPPELWKIEPDPSALDLIYITHAHADHYFGLPPVLGRMWVGGRRRPLTIMSQAAVITSFRGLMVYAYRSLGQNLEFPVEFVEVFEGCSIESHGFGFRFASTAHSAPNLAIRVENDGHAICYSGDGNFTDASRELYHGADLVVHEAFSFNPMPIHACIPGVLAMAAEMGVRRAALVHVERSVRRERSALFAAMLAAPVRCSLPQPGDVLIV